MPIKVTCSCGAKFAAKDELAGKKVKCPKCQVPLMIPAAQSQPSGPQQQQQAPRPAQPAAAAPQAQPRADDIFTLAPQEGNRQVASDPFMSDLLAEAGVVADPNYRGPRCPGCNAPIQQGAVLCVKCGFDFRTGHRIRSEVGQTSEFGHLSHAANAEELIKKAEKEIAETPIQVKDSDYGDMLTAFLLTGGIALVSIISLGVGYLAFRWIDVSATSITGIGMIILMIGVPMGFIGQVWMLVLAFMEDTIQGVLCLLVPCYQLYWGFTHMSTAAIPFVLWVVGNMMCNAAFVMFGIGDQESTYKSPPAIERVEDQMMACSPPRRSAVRLDSALPVSAARPFVTFSYPHFYEVSSCELPLASRAVWSLAS